MAALQGGMIETRSKDCQLVWKCSTKQVICHCDLDFCVSDPGLEHV